MSTLEIIAGAVLILASLVIILVVLAQDSKEQGLTSAIGGGYNESFFEGNKGRTKDAKLSRFTKVSAVIIFIVTLALNVLVSLRK
ncbi:MAG: preprotein translocase subunit SecG [Oscillospiraceae bacterium]